MKKQLIQEIHHLHAKICSGLADPNRILILYTLSEGDCNVNHLVETLGLPQPRVSRHLKVLRECNLVRSRREGQMVYYSLEDARVIDALDILRSVMASSLENQVSLAETLSTLE